MASPNPQCFTSSFHFSNDDEMGGGEGQHQLPKHCQSSASVFSGHHFLFHYLYSAKAADISSSQLPLLLLPCLISNPEKGVWGRKNSRSSTTTTFWLLLFVCFLFLMKVEPGGRGKQHGCFYLPSVANLFPAQIRFYSHHHQHSW